MNILIPHKWLLEYLETEADPQTIQTLLSLSGPSVEHIYEREGDSVYDIEITTNRVDSMSIQGIARETATILSHDGIKAKLRKQLSTTDTDFGQKFAINSATRLPLPTIQNDPTLCKRLMAIVLSEVTLSPTPDWMAARLAQVEANIHNSAIDITNYITHEIGHPVHAFDYDKLMALGGEIIIKEAERGKKFVTLDGIEYTTVGGEVVFENRRGEIIDLPSIKGTANSSIDDNTKNILLLIDSVDAVKVRFASMTHQIRTVAAQLVEKSIDPHLAPPTLELGIKLYQDLCGAKIASPLFDEFPGDTQLSEVELPLNLLNTYLGVELKSQTVSEILTSLGCRVREGDNSLIVQPPTYRPDIAIPADLIEEIARIYGYHNLPSKLMTGELPQSKPSDSTFDLQSKIRHFLADIGWQEVYTFSIVSEALAQNSGFTPEKHLKLENPLTEDHVYLRRSLTPSLEKVIDENPNRESVSVFELANTYLPQENELPEHNLQLGMVSNKPYRKIKGDLEALLRHLFIDDWQVNQEIEGRGVKENSTNNSTSANTTASDSVQSPAQTSVQSSVQAEIVATVQRGENKTPITIGKIEALPNSKFAISIAVRELSKVVSTYPRLQSLPKAAPVLEDMTFTLPQQVLVGQVVESIKAVSGSIYQVELKDIYQQNYTFGLMYLQQLHQYPDNSSEQVSAEQVKEIRDSIIKMMEEQFSAKLVGETG